MIKSLKGLGIEEWQLPTKRNIFLIEVVKADGKTHTVCRDNDELEGLEVSLKRQFPQQFNLKTFPIQINMKMTPNALAEYRLPFVKDFLNSLVKMPENIRQSKEMIQFFEPNFADKERLSKNTSKSTQVYDLTIKPAAPTKISTHVPEFYPLHHPSYVPPKEGSEDANAAMRERQKMAKYGSAANENVYHVAAKMSSQQLISEQPVYEQEDYEIIPAKRHSRVPSTVSSNSSQNGICENESNTSKKPIYQNGNASKGSSSTYENEVYEDVDDAFSSILISKQVAAKGSGTVSNSKNSNSANANTGKSNAKQANVSTHAAKFSSVYEFVDSPTRKSFSKPSLVYEEIDVNSDEYYPVNLPKPRTSKSQQNQQQQKPAQYKPEFYPIRHAVGGVPTGTAGSSSEAMKAREKQQIVQRAEEKLNRKHVRLARQCSSSLFADVFQASLLEGVMTSVTLNSARNVTVKASKNPDSSFPNILAEEASFYEKLNVQKSNFIAGLAGFISDKIPNYLVIEYMPFGDLKSVLIACEMNDVQLADLEFLQIFRQASSAMVYLEQKGLYARVVLANCFSVGPGLSLKMSDFGMTAALSNSAHVEKLHALQEFPWQWMAPESLSANIFNSKSDMWSFGVFMWEVYSYGTIPFQSLTSSTILAALRSNKRLPQPTACSLDMFALLLQCWENDPLERHDFAEVELYVTSKVNLYRVKTVGSRVDALFKS